MISIILFVGNLLQGDIYNIFVFENFDTVGKSGLSLLSFFFIQKKMTPLNPYRGNLIQCAQDLKTARLSTASPHKSHDFFLIMFTR
jgi:hypothetical protein